MLKTWAARHWAAHGTGPHGTGPHGTGPHGTGPKFFRDGAASGPSCHTPPCYLLRGTAALAKNGAVVKANISPFSTPQKKHKLDGKQLDAL